MEGICIPGAVLALIRVGKMPAPDWPGRPPLIYRKVGDQIEVWLLLPLPGGGGGASVGMASLMVYASSDINVRVQTCNVHDNTDPDVCTSSKLQQRVLEVLYRCVAIFDNGWLGVPISEQQQATLLLKAA